jgi:choline kinase
MPSFIHEIINDKKTNFIILSAGENKTRGQHNAKSLLQINDEQRLLDLQINIIKKYTEENEIYVAIGYQSQIITRHLLEKHPQIKIIENKNYKKTTPLESLRLCLNCCHGEDTYVIYGDKYFDIDSINFENRSSPTVVESISATNVKSDPGLIYQDGTLKRISYGTKKKWGQIFYIPKSLFFDFRHRINNCKKSYYNTFDIINEVAQVYQFKVHKSKSIKELP